MTKHKHTPAPWEIETIESEDCLSYAILGCQYESEKQANARLIAAAPELLEALETACEIIRDSYGEEDVDIPSDCQAVNVMERAIAKAKGKI